MAAGWQGWYCWVGGRVGVAFLVKLEAHSFACCHLSPTPSHPRAPAAGVEGAAATVPLSVAPGPPGGGGAAAKFPHLAGATRLEVPEAALERVAGMLTGQLAVSVAAGDGSGALDATGVQLAGVLDDLFATGGGGGGWAWGFGGRWGVGRRALVSLSFSPARPFCSPRRRRPPPARPDAPLGCHVCPATGRPAISLWAPTARAVSLLRWRGPRGGEPEVHPMARGERGVWRLEHPPDWERRWAGAGRRRGLAASGDRRCAKGASPLFRSPGHRPAACKPPVQRSPTPATPSPGPLTSAPCPSYYKFRLSVFCPWTNKIEEVEVRRGFGNTSSHANPKPRPRLLVLAPPPAYAASAYAASSACTPPPPRTPSRHAARAPQATDPYSRCTAANGERSLVLSDMAAPDVVPAGWRGAPLPAVAWSDISVYELHIRDFRCEGRFA
jgi:hypothetical protein